MKILKEGIAPYFMKISEVRDQLQELGEIMFERERTIIVLNALPKDWGNSKSSIYAKKEATTLNEKWYLCKTKETRLEAKEDVGSKEQAFAIMAKRMGKFGKFGPRRTNNKDMSKIQCYGCEEYGQHKRNCPKLKRTTTTKERGRSSHDSRSERRRKEAKEGRSSQSLL